MKMIASEVYKNWNGNIFKGTKAISKHKCFSELKYDLVLRTAIRGFRGMAKLTQGNQQLLVVKDKVGRLQINFIKQVYVMW